MFLRPCTKKVLFQSTRYKQCNTSVLSIAACAYRHLHASYPAVCGSLSVSRLSENVKAYNIMLANASNGYSLAKFDDSGTVGDHSLNTFIEKLDPKSGEKTPSEILDNFIWFSNFALKEHIDISSNIFDNHIDALADNMHHLSDAELEKVCINLHKWAKDNKKSRNYIEVWCALDNVISKRVYDWGIEKVVFYLDHLYHLGLFKNVVFPKPAINKLARKYKFLTEQQLVQTLFYIGATRIPPCEMHNLEVKLKDYLDSIKMEELAIICMGFMKSKTLLREPALIAKVIQRFIKEVDTLDNFTISVIVTLLRKSARKNQMEDLEALADSLVKQIPRLNHNACANIALLGTRTGLYHKDSLEVIANKMIEDPSGASLLDMERMLSTYTMFNFNHKLVDELTSTIRDELRNPRLETEIHYHGMCFINCLYFLAVVGKYPLDLISMALSREYIKEAYGDNYNLGNLGLGLDCSVEIECRNYKGPRMEFGRRYYLSRFQSSYIPEVGNRYNKNHTETTMLEVMLLIEKIRGKKYMYTGFILPHFEKAGNFVILLFTNYHLLILILRDLKNCMHNYLYPLSGLNVSWLIFSACNVISITSF